MMRDDSEIMRRTARIRYPGVTVLCVLLLGALLVFFRFELGNVFGLVLRGERTTGEALAVDDSVWIVRFQTADGSIIRRSLATVTRRPSSNPEVFYDPARPTHFMMRGERKGPIILFGVLLLAACVSLAYLIRQFVRLTKRRSGTSVRPVDQEPR